MFAQLPPATRAIIVVNALVFVLQLATGHAFDAIFALWPRGPYFRVWQLVTYAFLHENLMHIALNMFAVFMFAGMLERFWGTKRFVVFYFASLLAAGLTQLIVTGLAGIPVPTIGASGAVFGLLFAFAFYFPRQRVIFLLLPIPMPAWLLVTLYGLAELYQGVSGSQPNVAHFAHLGGMLGGALVILYWRARGTEPRY